MVMSYDAVRRQPIGMLESREHSPVNIGSDHISSQAFFCARTSGVV